MYLVNHPVFLGCHAAVPTGFLYSVTSNKLVDPSGLTLLPIASANDKEVDLVMLVEGLGLALLIGDSGSCGVLPWGSKPDCIVRGRELPPLELLPLELLKPSNCFNEAGTNPILASNSRLRALFGRGRRCRLPTRETTVKCYSFIGELKATHCVTMRRDPSGTLDCDVRRSFHFIETG